MLTKHQQIAILKADAEECRSATPKRLCELKQERDEARASLAAIVQAMKDLLRRDERNTCQHENTHRGGVLWEICDECGAEWADDQGGKPYPCPHKQEPQAIPQAEIDALPVGRAYGGTEPKPQASAEPRSGGKCLECEGTIYTIRQAVLGCDSCEATWDTEVASAEPTRRELIDMPVEERRPHLERQALRLRVAELEKELAGLKPERASHAEKSLAAVGNVVQAFLDSPTDENRTRMADVLLNTNDYIEASRRISAVVGFR